MAQAEKMQLLLRMLLMLLQFRVVNPAKGMPVSSRTLPRQQHMVVQVKAHTTPTHEAPTQEGLCRQPMQKVLSMERTPPLKACNGVQRLHES